MFPETSVVDLVDPREHADLLIGEVDVRVDQELLRQLDDRAIRAADVLARAARRPQARDDIDDEVDLVREQRIQVDERLGRKLGEADVGGQLRGVREPATVLREQLTKLGLGIGVLGEDTLARDFGDVGWFEMNLQRLREAVHQAGELHP